jgi:hypothetical protein
MDLQIKDRLYIPALLPKEGNFKQFNLKKEIFRKVEISEKERKELGITENSDTQRIEWNTEKDILKAFDFSAEELDFLKICVEKISDEALPDDMWGTVEKIYNAISG